jgi:hypothetical protein
MEVEVVIAEGQHSTQTPRTAAKAVNILRGLSAETEAEVVTAGGQHSTQTPRIFRLRQPKL